MHREGQDPAVLLQALHEQQQQRHRLTDGSAAAGAKRLQKGHGQLLLSVDAVLLPEPTHEQAVEVRAEAFRPRNTVSSHTRQQVPQNGTAIGAVQNQVGKSATKGWVGGTWKLHRSSAQTSNTFVSMVSGMHRGRTGRLRNPRGTQRLHVITKGVEYEVAIDGESGSYHRIDGAHLRLGAVLLADGTMVPQSSSDPFGYRVKGAWLHTPKIVPKMEIAWVEVMMLGLRNLQPRNLVPIIKPFVSFSVDTRFSLEESEEVARTNPSNTPTAMDPNFEEKPLLIKVLTVHYTHTSTRMHAYTTPTPSYVART
jgi:hypothetical protein